MKNLKVVKEDGFFKKGEIVWRSSGVMDHGSLLRKAQSYID